MKVYWSRCGPRHGNFGDKLTPLLLESVGLKVTWAPPEGADLIGIGSILEKVPARFKGIVWTSGFKFAGSKANLGEGKIIALRGRLSAERVGGLSEYPTVLGDGGLLCHAFAGTAKKRFKMGLIPHFVDAEDPIIRHLANSSAEIRLIDICDETQQVIDLVNECETIISSSLHGLILADALGIPAAWIELNRGAEVVEGEGFKFRDYFSAFGLREIKPMRLSHSDNLDTLLPQLEAAPRPGLGDLQSKLRATLEDIARNAPKMTVAVAEAQRAWNSRLLHAEQLLRTIVSPGIPFLCVDEDQIRSRFSDLLAVPFLEKNGLYWGPPQDSSEAIASFKAAQAKGIHYIAFFPPAFWWLEHYVEFSSYLREHGLILMEHKDLIVFKLPTEPTV